MIKDVPHVAKFLKDLCTRKRKLNVHKEEYMAATATCYIQGGIPPKHKDPRCPTISFQISNFTIKKALLDLGTSVNILPYSIYLQFDLGEIQDAYVVLRLTDSPVKVPRGIIKDVLVQVDEFVYPTDFVILDTHQKNGAYHRYISSSVGHSLPPSMLEST